MRKLDFYLALYLFIAVLTAGVGVAIWYAAWIYFGAPLTIGAFIFAWIVSFALQFWSLRRVLSARETSLEGSET